MTHNSEQCRSNCPINFVLETFGDKWTLLIIRDLMFKGKRYYGEFLSSPEKISTNILADRLQRLEAQGIISKQGDPEHRSRVIYRLSDKGRALLPIMLEMTSWSATYDSHSNTPAEFLGEFKKNKTKMIKNFKSAMK